MSRAGLPRTGFPVSMELSPFAPSQERSSPPLGQPRGVARLAAVGPKSDPGDEVWKARGLCLPVSGGEVHHLQRCATIDAVRIAQVFEHLEVIVARSDNDVGRLPRQLKRQSELARLTLIFCRIERPIA